MDKRDLLTIRAMGLGSEGQMTHAQWEQHCADTPGLAEAWAVDARNPESARLIAAAPAMLAALKDVDTEARMMGYDDDLARAVRAAIAKATTPTLSAEEAGR